MHKYSEKQLAIKLRKEGKTYSDILKEVHVSKSTLSLWLREVGLSKTQKQKLTEKRKQAQQRGGDKRHAMRLAEEKEMIKRGVKDVKNLSTRELFMIGIALYWAEGSKKSADRPGVMVDFGNSDPTMVALFIKWLQNFCDVTEEDFILRLHLHQSHKVREKEIISKWAKELSVPTSLFAKTTFKKHNPKTVRYKIGEDYIGLVSVRVKKSTTLNRRIMGWIYAIIATQK